MKRLVCFLFLAGMILSMTSCDEIKEWTGKITGKTEQVEKEQPTEKELVEQKEPVKKKVVKKRVVKKVIKKIRPAAE